MTSYPAQRSGEAGASTNWNGSFRDIDLRGGLTGTGRRRIYVNAISLPQTCRSNWHAT